MNRNVFCFAVGLICVFGMVLRVAAQSSASYEMKRVAVVAGGTMTTSPTFENRVVIAQESLSGATSACNAGFVNSLGFWSVLGDNPVPVLLTVRLNQDDQNLVELVWSGADDAFQVFRDFTPEDIVSPTNLDQETDTCIATDYNMFASDIIFYRVIPKP